MYLHPELKHHFSPDKPLFDQIMALKGESFRHQEGRLTQRIFLGDKSYFIKQHTGVGWKEIFKNLVQFRWPVLSARNEWRAIKKLASLQVAVPSVVGYGRRGFNPATMESFILMEEIAPTISLETLCANWKNTPPSFLEKQCLLTAIADIARVMHQHGINHRDFYLCHFLLDQAVRNKLYLIDLHRAAVRDLTPERWIIKDLAGLYFSSKGIGLTQRDLYRFMKTYHQTTLRQIIDSKKNFWQKVLTRGNTYRDHTQPTNDFHSATFTFAGPFQLRLADNQLLYAEEVVRVLPGRRLVVFGTWQNKPVVAKLFFDSKHAKRDMERDAAGVASLIENKIPTPTLFCKTISEDGRVHVLIFERISKAISLEDKWLNKRNNNDLLPVLQQVTVEIATHHVLGILQHDLHLNNFLVTKKKIYTLDGAQVEIMPRLLPKKKSMKNFALFLSQLGVGVAEYQEKLFRHYAKARGWLLKDSDIIFLFQLIKQWNALRWRRYEKKIFRNCSDFAKGKNWHTNYMVDRQKIAPELAEFLRQPDAVFSDRTATPLKAGRSTTVIKVTFDNREYVIKRYNLKNNWHRLRRCLRPTRAAEAWGFAHKLNLFGVRTTKPIAFLEKNVFGLRGKSYVVTEYIPSEHIGDYFRRHQHDAKKTNDMVQRVSALLKSLVELELTHGDLKMTNILIDQQEQPVLIDLDGMSEHATLTGLKHTWYKEIQRFLRNFDDMPELVQKLKTIFS